MPLTTELRDAALRLLADGHSITHIAESLGVSRQKLYRAAKHDPELQAAMRRSTAPDGDPAPWNEHQYDNRVGLTSWHEPLTGEQVADFTKALRQTKRIGTAARAAGIDMYPDRIRWSEVSKRKRGIIRDALEKIRQPDPDPAAETKAAFAGWLRGEGWPADADLDADLLAELSARAADDYARHRLMLAAETAANNGDT